LLALVHAVNRDELPRLERAIGVSTLFRTEVDPRDARALRAVLVPL
jgi:hypothetical protein